MPMRANKVARLSAEGADKGADVDEKRDKVCELSPRVSLGRRRKLFAGHAREPASLDAEAGWRLE